MEGVIGWQSASRVASVQSLRADSKQALPMSREADRHRNRIDSFFAGPGARADRWCHLMELADAWSNGTGERLEFEAALAEMTPIEEFHAYPGLQLMAALREHSAANDA